MTDGERMVWAAAYASRLQYWATKKRPDHETEDSWRRYTIHDSMEHAAITAASLRYHEDTFKERQGADSTAYKMLVDMIGRQQAPYSTV